MLRKSKEGGLGDMTCGNLQVMKAVYVITEADPLYGVLSDDQVGLNPITGRLHIAAEVLEGIRLYLSVSGVEERLARIERVNKSLSDLANDPIGGKTVLRLEPAPLISADIDKGKGHVFDFEAQDSQSKERVIKDQDQKLFSAAIRSGLANTRETLASTPLSDLGEDFFYNSANSYMSCTTAYIIGLFEASSFGTLTKKGKPRKRPYKSKKKLKGTEEDLNAMVKPRKEGYLVGVKAKRKAIGEGE